MIQTIKNLQDELLRNYDIRCLVNQAKELGEYLQELGLKTNQIRKFLDAVNRLKVKLSQDKDERFSSIETEVYLLKPKLAYATARKENEKINSVKPLNNEKINSVKPLNDVLSEAIDKVKDTPDFYRLVNLIESIIAYHKAAETNKSK
ncbi:type III-A CRISPR-associated protein Csm2 [Aphanizomenon flos-aquae FACHB-1416]|uniref:CRISPR system Cms protein Csm2 n=2 Tax=Aphanizomenonaceae TaxID=1892259 RepID=A0ABR8IR90_APHFL|nr:type III-A CRISPR-associated protein Csm2 [Aphanizomenon flos-aquae FACHB-1171]MBD2555354.1 type III-A CRISPR-associated protein Csm2 [Aphanizomenon flos-aquae FACHB-1290]MBD2631527.1 type III-A CRISPR-associated protein Csm2 [Aphanizomenon sp. FACHB-1399]MBD2642253.1 type III-A CRISPR-associated protein Csm2 [Aphanizomenon sp. FACHB-1401]MBD2656204.1 type III-A CRISPR-associated protein Csm2 [Aphanizomenon flos-aquae FACHB-1265]MBD2674880.1 type III-A CRISPR-associated protein Csm2 [Aphani